MKKRADTLARIGRLAAQMHELGRWRLTAIEREQADLEGDLRAAFAALESGGLATGALASFATRRVRGLQTRLDALERESERTQRAAELHGRRAKLAEEAATTAARDHRDRQARKELADLVERTLVRRDASQA